MSSTRTDAIHAFLEESGCPFVQTPFEVEKFLAVMRQALRSISSSALKS